MRIRWTGAQVIRRVVGAYEWSRDVGFVQEVDDPVTVATLLTEPDGRFIVDPDEPLLALKGVGEQTLAELALAGIATVAALAALDADGVARLDQAIWASARQIKGWVDAARKVLNPTSEREEDET